MSEAEGERTPLVYEDRVGLSDTAASSRRKYICIAATIVCVGVGLTLAIAIPLSMTKEVTGHDQGPMVLKAQARQQVETEEYSTSEAESTTPSSFNFSTTESPHSFRTRNFTFTRRHLTSTTPHPSPSGPPDPFNDCPSVPSTRRSPIDLDILNGKMLFEIFRIQTPNAPSYVDGISCSLMQLDLELEKPGNDSDGKNASVGKMELKWYERGYFTRFPKTDEVQLSGELTPPYDFTETHENTSVKGRLSLLVALDGYLMTQECFPSVRFPPRPAYVIHLYSLLPWRGNRYITTALLNLANIWGLNPAEERFTEVSHLGCTR